VKPLVLVCGGSGGIGSAVCRALHAREFIPIVGYAHARDTAHELAERCEGHALELDLTRSRSIDAATDQLATLEASQELALEAVVLAATGPLELAPIGRLSARDLEHQWTVHVAGPHELLTQLMRRCLRKRRRGTLVGVLSEAMGGDERPATPTMGAYAIAKHGLRGLLAAFAGDYPWLRVRCVSPGFTRTPLLDAFDARFLEQLEGRNRFATPEEVAATIVAQLPNFSPAASTTPQAAEVESHAALHWRREPRA